MPKPWPALRTFVSVLCGALALGSVAAAQTPTSVWTIPGTVNAGGLNNTRFVSDLAVTNPGSVPVQATISFIPANGTTPKQKTLNAGETVVYRNVLDSLWGAQGAGATQIASDSPLLIRARTYNTAASGTYGVALPVFADDRLLSVDDSADSLWISQSADGSSGYRTNVAVVFPDAGGGAATVTVYGADGSKIGSQDFSLDAPGFQQFGVGGFAGAVSIARARVRVSRGRAAGYSVVVDNITGDSSLFTFESLPAGRQDVLVNGVARANGRNNTFFRTDGRFYNPIPWDAVVTVAFHASGDSNGAPVTRNFTIPAGRILDVTDVLDSLLSIPVGSAGALRFTSNAPVAILCRTSNVDPLGVKPGTYGAQQKPASLLSFLMSADAGAVVTGIRQNAAFRTNVGFAAGVDGAAYSLTLKSASGATVATATGSLGAFGWTQPNVADLFPGTTIPDDATLLVKVTSGSVDVFDSSIDNASGDPVVTPIMPLPVDIPSSATIGPLGGSIRSSDGRFTLKVPAGVLSTPTAFSIVPVANDAPDGVGPAYEVTPDPFDAAGAVRVVLTYLPADLAGTGPSALRVTVDDNAAWRSLQAGAVDPIQRSITAPLVFTGASAVASTPGRSALAPPAKRRGALFNYLYLDPKEAAILTSQSLILQIRASGPGVGLIKDPKWEVDGEGVLTPNGLTATYQAPAIAPDHVNPVTILADFLINEADGPHVYSVVSKVRILPVLPDPSIRDLLVNERAGTLTLVGYFGSTQGKVTVGGQPLPIESWAPDSIVCTLYLTGPGSNGDVIVELPAGPDGLLRKSNVRQLTEWDIPLHYTWTDAFVASTGVPGLKFEGTNTLRFRGDAGSYRKAPGTDPYFPTRGMNLTRDSFLRVTGSGSGSDGGGCVHTLSGVGTFVANTAGDVNIPLQIVAVLKVATDTGQGAIGLGFGVTGLELPFTITTVCGPNTLPITHPFPDFEPLQGGDYFPIPELDDIWWPVPLPAFTVTFDSQFRILRRTFSGSGFEGDGTVTVEWLQDVNPISAPEAGYRPIR